MTASSTPAASTPQSTPRSDALTQRLRQELRSAEAAHIGDGPGRVVHVRVPLRLLEQARRHTGIKDDDALMHAALVHLVMDESGHRTQ